ncbi:hypothetical protein GCM10017044_20060 [Kordiimonas sediminis]|uniref:Uncharacterized protein n=1 Tax=Kordiimonas sediminis TaxID=1735581 RepID=A0A919ATC6_9PROT|nr:hypothetical protein GCM10017044_20060 [Kordiimonas sediminis]
MQKNSLGAKFFGPSNLGELQIDRILGKQKVTLHHDASRRKNTLKGIGL